MRLVGQWLHDVAQAALDWLPLAFFVLTALIVYLLWRTLQVMPRTSPSHLDPGSSSSVTWDDVAGVDEAQAELEEVVDFLRHPKRFERLGARVPKGILLYGPPGTGKTLLAERVGVRRDVRGPRRGADPQAVRRGPQARAVDRLHRRARRRRGGAHRA